MSHSAPPTPALFCLEKVTAFITRGAAASRELLVFRHPHGNVQLPAGTVEEGEPAVEAALREVWEETGLTAVRVVAHLASDPQPMRPDELVVLRRVGFLQQPAPDAPAVVADFPSFLGLRRGFYVRLLGWSDDRRYAKIAYEEFEGRIIDFARPTRSLHGWVESDAVANRTVRHFFHITPTEPTPDAWVQIAEEWEHRFELFWVPLTGTSPAVPDLIPFQAAWLEEFAGRIVAGPG